MIPNDWITNKFNKLEVNKLLVASITPNSSFSSFLWCFCASMNVINSGILVIKPNIIPNIASDMWKKFAKFSNDILNEFPIIYKATLVIIK